MSQPSTAANHLERRIGLRSAVTLNMLEMIGVGPFITLPLIIAAAGYRLSIWAWLLGAAIAIADGMVWAELGAAFPRAGGSYAFLREIYGSKGPGNWLSFLYVWQLCFTAPLSIASGCIGLAGFLPLFWPALAKAPFAFLPGLPGTSIVAAVICLLVTMLLYRKLGSVTKLAWILFAGVLMALIGVTISGFAHAHAVGGWTMPYAPTLPLGDTFRNLAQGTLLTTYCYWGYYNICFLGSETRRPERTIPRSILISVVLVSILYVLMNLAVLPALQDAAKHSDASAALRLQMVAEIARTAFGPWAGYLIALLIMWTAFSSVFSLLLGYSRVPFAAARDGNFFAPLGAIHPKHHIPHRALVLLGVTATLFCFFKLQDVITLLVVTRIFLQFGLQQIGVVLLRWKRPELERPFRMPLYPLPPLFALAGFIFIVANRNKALWGVVVALGVGLVGTLIYLIRARFTRQWPFAETER